MSTRLYPLFVKGNPQLRIFLPNFWMKLVKPAQPVPPNEVHFMVSIQMTSHDIKNYLEKIYNVPVMRVTTKVWSGEIKKNEYFGTLRKEDDYRMAYVELPRDYKFEFPELFPKEEQKEVKRELKDYNERIEEFKKNIINENRIDIPSWYNL